MIWRSLFKLTRSVPISHPARSDFPILEDFALSRVQEYQCYPDDRGYCKRDPPRSPNPTCDHQRGISEPASDLPKPQDRSEDFGAPGNENQPPQFSMGGIESLRGAASEKIKKFMSSLGAAARKSFGGMHSVNVPVQGGFAVP